MDQLATKPIIALDVFEGPLDLLLQLIEQQRLDVTMIALAQVADQYLATVRAAVAPSPAALAEFLVIGARLLLIKTRALLPPAPVEEVQLVGDPAEQLVRQVQEYRRFKQAAAALRVRDDAGLRTYTRVNPPPLPPAPPQRVSLDVSLAQLVAAVERRLRLLQDTSPPPVVVPQPKIMTIADVTAHVQRRLAAHAWITFDDLLGVSLSRTDVIVTLWTVLELFKRQVITLEQETLFGPISLGRGAAFREFSILSSQF